MSTAKKNLRDAVDAGYARKMKIKTPIQELEELRGKWINGYYRGKLHIDVTECADDLGIWLEDNTE